MSDEGTGEVEALAALLEADSSGNHSILQATIGIVAAALTYGSVTVFLIHRVGEDFPLSILPFVPLPVICLMTFQMLLAAVSMRRAISIGYLERRLVQVAGVEAEYKKGVVGSPSSEVIININAIQTGSGFAGIRLLRTALAVIPYVGLYFLGVAFTVYTLAIIFALYDGAEAKPLFWVSSFVYVVIWEIVVFGGIVNFQGPESADGPSAPVNARRPGTMDMFGWCAAIAGLAGVGLQYLQSEDDTQPLLYFTVISALLFSVAYFLPHRHSIRPVGILAASSGILLSSIVYWVAIVPVAGAPQSGVGVMATLTLHVILPSLVLGTYLNGQRRDNVEDGRWVITVIFPLSYLLAILAGQSFGMEAPYTFVDASAPFELLIAAVIIGAVFLAIGYGLRFVAGRMSMVQGADTEGTH